MIPPGLPDAVHDADVSVLLHLSDPHFGAEEPQAVTALLALAEQERPDVVVASGDITQRAPAGAVCRLSPGLRRQPRAAADGAVRLDRRTGLTAALAP
jgi:3',5'-cyclic AMP phosphodiesterase CpdA